MTASEVESQPRWLDDDEKAAWLAFLAARARIDRVLDRQLTRDAGLPHAYYQVLAMLSDSPDRTTRMSDLARDTNSSQSRMSHAVARLEALGWVRREPCPTDARGQLAVLTDDGFAVLAAAAPGHVEAVRRVLFDHLSRAQVRALAEAFRAVEDAGTEA
jgi:DNA-binding MarR family transcriptional regulator